MKSLFTPWGRADGVYNIAPGVIGVTTPGHGGILVDKSIFLLDIRLRYGLFTPPYGTIVPFEEDLDEAALIHCHPELLARAIRAGYFAEGLTIERVTESVARSRLYLLAPEPRPELCNVHVPTVEPKGPDA